MYIVAKRKWRYPLSIEREYAKILVAYVKKKMQIIKTFLPDLEALAQNYSAASTDVLLDLIARKTQDAGSMQAQVSRIYARVDSYNAAEFTSICYSVFGTQLTTVSKNRQDADDLQALKEAWVQQNIDLIKSIDSRTMERIRQSLSDAIIQNVSSAELSKYLSEEIQKLAGTTISRATLIGVDQVGKLNGMMTQYRQQYAGIDRYEWETAHDSRVRPAHRARQGKTYKWDEPPADGNPGVPIRCRCVALPVFDMDKVPIRTKTGTFIAVNAVARESGVLRAKEPAMYPDDIAGAPRGEPMSEEKADKGRPNPNYNDSNAYRVNCQSCVVTYEARLRGYDVETLPNPQHDDSILTKLSHNTRLAWIDPETRKTPDFIPHPSRGGPKMYFKWLENVLKPSERYTMQVFWKTGDEKKLNGHIVHVRKNAAGDVEIYDPQTSIIYRKNEMIQTSTDERYTSELYTFGGHASPIEDFLSRVYYNHHGRWLGPEILRVDDKLFNMDIVDKIMRKAKGTK